ncbi:MAG TPA: hypothetical protein VEB20_15355 [Azospirillaceae bacterium]|nr:hypothetical protein [Azospirillaceae bacterium]
MTPATTDEGFPVWAGGPMPPIPHGPERPARDPDDPAPVEEPPMPLPVPPAEPPPVPERLQPGA